MKGEGVLSGLMRMGEGDMMRRVIRQCAAGSKHGDEMKGKDIGMAVESAARDVCSV